MNLAPVILFVYNRPDHTRQMVEALQKNELAKESDLFIFSDAPKKHEIAEAVRKVRQYIHTINGFRSVSIVERDNNLGLANSVIDGVTRLCDKHGRVIVLEDDHITSPYFLRFMNEALEHYQNEPRVMQVSGYMFPLTLETDKDTVFLRLTTSWGWGIWKRAWDKLDPFATRHKEIEKDRKLLYRFNLNGSYPYYKMLEAQLNGDIDSWAILFHYSVFIENGIVLHPKQSLISNIGFDDGGTHCGIDILQAQKITDFKVVKYPDKVAENHKAKTQVFKYLFLKDRRKNTVNTIRYYIKNLLKTNVKF